MNSSLPKNISFVDIETTGTSTKHDRIIEIGILRVENNKLKKTFSTLLNPETRINPFIVSMTGIQPEELENAPTFYSIKDQILELLEDCIFVAHNVRFDYGFLRNEFKRHEISFSQKQLCTVKLARHLSPGHAHYNLDAIMERYNIACKRRHRAFDDAKVLWDFYKKAQKQYTKDGVAKAIDLAMKRPTVPVNISNKQLESLPESPGVYIFYGETGVPLYIGKSINLRDRVLSHFSNDHLSTTDMAISRQIKSIETVKTAGELGALLLEATMIKKHQPLYNRKLRYARRVVVVEKYEVEGYLSAKIVEKEDIHATDLENVISVFRSIKQAKEYLRALCKQYNLCLKMCNLEKTNRHCFYYSLGTCNGACVGKENFLKYNMRFVEAISIVKIKRWPFHGPIVIKETTSGQDNFLVDQWCLLGKVSEGDSPDILLATSRVAEKNEYRFDNDTYKILYRFLQEANSHSKITPLNHYV